MAKKQKISKKKIMKFVLSVVFVILLIVGYCVIKGEKKNPKKKQEVKVEEKIEQYGYELNNNETEYYKSLFQELKKVLQEEPIDEEKYASLVSQLFLANFFNLDNKLSQNDVGGLQFVYSEFRGDVEKFAKEGIYHYVANNIYGDRTQELPVVKEVSVVNIEKTEARYLDRKEENAYQVDLKIMYEKDLGYQESATLLLVSHNDKFEIIKMSE